MINIFQKIIFFQKSLYDLIIFPVRNSSPLTELVWISALTGLLMVNIYKIVSNQEKIKKVKKKIKCHFLEVQIYKDDLGDTLLAQKNILKANLRYLWLSFVPGTVLVCIVFFILIQLHCRFSYKPIEVGEKVCVSIRFDVDKLLKRNDVRLILPEGIKQDSPLLFVPNLNEFSWRIKGEREGHYKIGFETHSETHQKELAVGSIVSSISPKRTTAGWANIINYPSEKFLPKNSSVKEIYTPLHDREISINNSSYNWLVIFFPSALIFGLIFKKILNIA